ncbi:RNA polymerase II holoenzyme cyclin-like subunit [Ophidiomyces ophidiicola]|nr:RNA polymerase II holoenzyme cyclin-like subunit [Ophidiomyces ophidiicola]KAI1989472.1 RNA polymerase II holoenzyme cyclin-like subunit [Ophidiomyces ophidiicola]KAI1990564.1 RNA polymerase II holoenzyme cyclin-like subunit [Ophidiomyces ophidiicola]
MAADYWASTQYHSWLFDREELGEARKALADAERAFIQQYPLPDLRLFNIYIHQQLNKLSKRLTVRQQAVATAQVYVKRFYTKVEIRRTNPYLLLTTAFYLACKIEECPQHIRLVLGEARGLWPEFIVPDGAKIGECEFWLISELNSQLILHHPYRTLSELQSAIPMTSEELGLAWSIINDHYLTDLPLLHPPHVIAVTALCIAVIFKVGQQPVLIPSGPSSVTGALREGCTNVLSAMTDRPSGSMPARIQSTVGWIANSEVDIEAVVECTQEIVSLYEVWEQYSDKLCREQVGRFVKSRGLDK